MKVVVIGASRGTGLSTVRELLARGHEVTAVARTSVPLPDTVGLSKVSADVLREAELRTVIAGHDAVIVTLGISQNPIGVRLFGSHATPLRVRSEGTNHVVSAMQREGIRRIVVQSTYGTFDTYDRVDWFTKLFLDWIVGPQLIDSERQEEIVRNSGLDYTIVRPVHLTDSEAEGDAFVSTTGDYQQLRVSRGDVARCLVQALEEPRAISQAWAVSARHPRTSTNAGRSSQPHA